VANGIKSFEFGAKKAAGVKVIETFELNGESFDIRALKDSNVAYLVHQTKSGKANDVIAGVLDFMEKALAPDSSKRFAEVALDPDAGLTLEQIVEVFQYVLGVVGAHPTGPSSDSSSAPRRTGTGSRANSRSRASATP
jgi:hypothetical protein